MSITFEPMTRDEMLADHDAYWRQALRNLAVLEIDRDVTPELSARLPYEAAQAALDHHMTTCVVCQEEPWWSDACAENNRLATLAADAVAAQTDLASQN